MANLKITQVRGVFGRLEKQRLVMKGLGLKHMHHSVVRPDNASVRGMIFYVQHLVTVEETDQPVTPGAHQTRRGKSEG